MKRTIVSDLQPKITFTCSKLATPNGVGNLVNGLIGPILFIAHKLYVFDPDDIVIVPDRIIDKILRVLRQNRPSTCLTLKGLILQPLIWYDDLESVVFQSRFQDTKILIQHDGEVALF